MVELDSPNIFWTRCREPEPDRIVQSTFHDEPFFANKDNRRIAVQRKLNKNYICHWFDDPSMLYRMEGWWLDN